MLFLRVSTSPHNIIQLYACFTWQHDSQLIHKKIHIEYGKHDCHCQMIAGDVFWHALFCLDHQCVTQYLDFCSHTRAKSLHY